MNPATTPVQRALLNEQRWMVGSRGPDRLNDAEQPGGLPEFIEALSTRATLSAFYDPTNGAVSRGDLFRTAKGPLN